MIAVGLVTMNRVNDNRYPDTPCEVVHQGPTRPSWKNKNISYPVKNRCQFSWYCDGKDDTPKNLSLYEDAVTVAKVSIQIFYTFGDITGGATHYHADYVTPSWAKTMQRVAKVDDHIFYDYRRKIYK